MQKKTSSHFFMLRVNKKNQNIDSQYTVEFNKGDRFVFF